ncbi:MAG: phosphoribosylformylglycinamidine synthase subunit PurS, partial [Lentisphaeria bacterium]|nr:phosphoribosylformylglycinamidine synthase subunit PurS [Lentisphaeria bacterium]
MDYRIEIAVRQKWTDARAESVKRGIQNILAITGVEEIRTRDVFTISADINDEQAKKIAQELANPVTQQWTVGQSAAADNIDFDFIIAVGFRPGVTDNVARTAHEAIGDIIGRKLSKAEQVFSSVEYLVKASSLNRADMEKIGKDLL